MLLFTQGMLPSDWMFPSVSRSWNNFPAERAARKVSLKKSNVKEILEMRNEILFLLKLD